MLQVLESLNQEVGVKGSMVVTQDGMVVASRLGGGLVEDLVAAMASSTILSFKRAISAFGTGDFSTLLVTASYGKMVFVELGNAYLVVVLNRRINLDVTLIAILGAAHKLRNISRLST
jgi:predicted regulator of Ras-like GTPase activity (Roadblock/LC7/MglB family)